MCFGILHIALLAHSGPVWLGCSSIFSRLSLYTSISCQRKQNMSHYHIWWWKAMEKSCSLLENLISHSSSCLWDSRLVLLLPHLALWGLLLLLGQEGSLYGFVILVCWALYCVVLILSENGGLAEFNKCADSTLSKFKFTFVRLLFLLFPLCVYLKVPAEKSHLF